MRITNKTAIAISVLAAIAARSGRRCPAIDMSSEIGVSTSYLEHLIKELRVAGFVTGRRGPGGGYRLRLPPNELSVTRIAETVDAHTGITHGNDHWREAARLLAREASGITIAEIIATQPRDAAA